MAEASIQINSATPTTNSVTISATATSVSTSFSYRIHYEVLNSYGSYVTGGDSSSWSGAATKTYSKSLSGLSSGTTYYAYVVLQYYQSGWEDSAKNDSEAFTTKTPTITTHYVTFNMGTDVSSYKVAYYNSSGARVPASGYTTYAADKSFVVADGYNFYVESIGTSSGTYNWKLYLNGSSSAYSSGTTSTINYTYNGYDDRTVKVVNTLPTYSVSTSTGSNVTSITPSSATVTYGSSKKFTATVKDPTYSWTEGSDSGGYDTYYKTTYVIYSGGWSVTYGSGSFTTTSGTATYFTPTSNSTISAKASGSATASSYRNHITYNANGGSGTMSKSYSNESSSITAAKGVIVRTNTFTRSGYVFTGWNTNSAGTGTPYSPGSSSISANTILYAQWSKTYDYNLQYWSDGVCVKSISTGTTTAATYTFTLSYVPTKTSHKFLGWDTSSSATTVRYNTGDTITLTGALKSYQYLYAVWKYEILKFYWDGAEGNDDNTIIYVGAPTTNLKATNWNRFKKKIKEINDAYGHSWTYTETASGAQITAADYNNARLGISLLTGHGSLPQEVASGDTIMAKFFLPISGSNNLRDALNVAIQYYNEH